MITSVLKIFSRLPLRLNHLVGATLGRIIFKWDKSYARKLNENLAISHIAKDKVQFKEILDKNVAESGKAFTELMFAWFRPAEEVASLVKDHRGWEHVENALAKKKSIIFITPHLGCFDIAGRYLTSKLPVTFMYSPPKQKWAAKLMNEGRERMNATMAPADMRGVRILLKTLKQGGHICILPDQAPSQGDGVWADFFGKPAYTMTLIGKLQNSTNAEVLMFFGERLPNGKGYRLWVEPLDAPLEVSPEKSARQINAAVEKLVRQCPEQYLWSYNRYKSPAGSSKKPAGVA